MHAFEPLSYRIIGAAYRVHNALGPGYLEHVYRNALVHELAREGLEARTEVPLAVHYAGVPVGHCSADLIVGTVVVETKAQEGILPGHKAQLRAYLRCSGYETGLVINFGPARVNVERVVETRVEKWTG